MTWSGALTDAHLTKSRCLTDAPNSKPVKPLNPRHFGSQELDRLDAFNVLKDRLYGLRCAIKGTTVSNKDERQGLLQLVDDLEGGMLEFRDLLTSPALVKRKGNFRP